MKKRIMILLCSAALTLGLTAAPAMASAGPFSPVEVETYTYGPLDEQRGACRDIQPVRTPGSLWDRR